MSFWCEAKTSRRYWLWSKRAMFAVRIIPFVPFDAVSYGAGIIGVPFSSFLLATSVGIIPSILVYSFVGSIAPNFYWWILITMLAISLIGVIAGLVVLRKRTPVVKSVGPTEAEITPLSGGNNILGSVCE